MRKFFNLLWVAASYVLFVANIWLLAAPFTAPFLVEVTTTYGGGMAGTLTGYINSTVLELTTQFYVIMGGLLLINLNVMLATRFLVLRNLANYVNVFFGGVVSFLGLAVFAGGFYIGLPTIQLVVAFTLLTLGWVYLDIAVRHLRGEKVNVAFRVAPEEEPVSIVPVIDVEQTVETVETVTDAEIPVAETPKEATATA